MDYVENRWINPESIEKRAYQENIVRSALTGNTLCVLPTGLGKTPIAALVAARRLEKNMSRKILFMAPTRPLVDQHRSSFKMFLKIGPSELVTVTGSDSPEDRAALYKKADVVFATPQTIRNDLKKRVLSLKDFSLAVFDEAHRGVGSYAYTYIARVYMQQADDPLILGLTASPGGHVYKVNEVRDGLFIENVEIRNREDPDVRPYVQPVEREWVTIELPTEMKSIQNYLENIKSSRIKKLMKWKVLHNKHVTKSQLLRLQQKLSRGKGMELAAMSVVAEIIKSDHALLLLETQCMDALSQYLQKLSQEAGEEKTKAAVRLMKDENMKHAARLTEKLLSEGREHPKLAKLKELVAAQFREKKDSRIIVFAQYRDTVAAIARELENVENAAPVEFIGQAVKRGKGLSQKEQIQILNEFEMGFHNVLCASQVAEEGLDVAETNVVIFYEPTPSAIRKIQRSGRTARRQAGKVTVLITKDTRDEAYRWSAHRKEKNMRSVIDRIQKKQRNLGDFG